MNEGRQLDPIERVARGDDHAMRDLLAAHGPILTSMCRRMLAGREAEDALQEILLEIWRSSSSFDPAKASERTFVTMIARRKLIDITRRRRPPSTGPEVDRPDTEAQRAPAERIQRVMQAFRALSPAEQAALRMVLQAGMTQSQIAKALDMPVGTIKSHVRRALLSLRDLTREEREGRDEDSAS